MSLVNFVKKVIGITKLTVVPLYILCTDVPL